MVRPGSPRTGAGLTTNGGEEYCGWVIKDAVKRKTPEGLPFPAALRGAAGEEAAPAPAEEPAPEAAPESTGEPAP